MKEKSLLQKVLEFEWTPIILGIVSSFWTATMDAWVGGVSLVMFGGLAMFKGFMK